MARKPIIDIEVNDAAFKRLLESFYEFNEDLDAMPDSWRAFDDAASEALGSVHAGSLTAKESIALAAAQGAMIADRLKEAAHAQDDFGDSTRKTNKEMAGLGKSVKNLGSELFSIGKWLLKFSAVGLGLGAIGSGFGISALAGSALSRLRSANQLGLNPGQLAAFNIQGQQFLTQSSLQAASEAQSDVTKAGYLAALGIDFRRAQSMSVTDLAFTQLKAARASYLQAQKAGVPAMQMPGVSAYLALGGNFGDIRNAALAKESEIDAAQRATNAQAGALGFDRRTAADWIELKKQLDTAGQTIETDLIRKLHDLAPEISALSKDVVGFIDSFLNGPAFDQIVASAKEGLHDLGDFLVNTDWKTVGADIKAVGEKIHDALVWLHIVPGTGTPDKGSHDNAAPGSPDWHETPGMKLLKRIRGALINAGTKAYDAVHGPHGIEANALHAMNAAASAVTGIPTSILDRLSMAESNYGDPNFLKSSAGAIGIDQLMPGTAKQYGAANSLDPAQNIAAAARYLSYLHKRYHGDWKKAVAAYNWGEGNLDADIRKHGKNWLRYAPDETRGEVEKVMGSHASELNARIEKLLRDNRGAKTNVQVSVTNTTAARVAVSMNAAAV